MSSPAIIFERVSYQYSNASQYALHNIHLQVEQGEFFGIIGATGAGKTTLCLALNGIVPQFYGGHFFGKISVMGLDTLETPISQLSGQVGQVFEDPETQLITTSVENEVAFALENNCVVREEIIERIRWSLSIVRLDGMEKKHPADLSGGQKQRLAIAAAIAQKPRILVLDEPTSQLDPVGSQEVFQVVRELNKKLGITVIVSSHAAEEMAEYADRIAVFDRGEMIEMGTPDVVYGDAAAMLKKGIRLPQVTQCFAPLQQRHILSGRLPVRLTEGIDLLPQVQEHSVPSSLTDNQLPDVKNRNTVISMQDLVYRYPDGTEALHNISLDIMQGEYVLLAGQNGAGKSTLVKNIMGLFKPTLGNVLVYGQDPEDIGVSGIAKRIGYISQNPDYQIFNTTVEDEVGYALKLLGYAEKEIKQRVEKSLHEMGLEQFGSTHPLSLSRGDRARVVIAAVLAMEPQMIIFDEPTIGQDLHGARMILEASQRLHKAGMTIILITHHLYLMPEYAQRMVVMGIGTVLLDAPIREAYYRIDMLRQTYLQPPQAVILGQEMQKLHPGFPSVLTPAEFASQFEGKV